MRTTSFGPYTRFSIKEQEENSRDENFLRPVAPSYFALLCNYDRKRMIAFTVCGMLEWGALLPYRAAALAPLGKVDGWPNVMELAAINRNSRHA